jgi:hypothetical protein
MRRLLISTRFDYLAVKMRDELNLTLSLNFNHDPFFPIVEERRYVTEGHSEGFSEVNFYHSIVTSPKVRNSYNQ